MKKTIAILALAALGITAANAGVRFGINFGIPVPAPVVVAGYVWVGGSWEWCYNHWVWTRGHWGPPARWDRDDHRDRDGHWGHGFRAERHECFPGGFHGKHVRG